MIDPMRGVVTVNVGSSQQQAPISIMDIWKDATCIYRSSEMVCYQKGVL